MMADECHQSRLVALMSTGYPPGDHVRTISAAPLRTIAVQRITLDMGDDVNVVTGGVGDE